MEILGILLNNLSLKEALNRSEIYLNQGGLNTIAYVSGRKLLEASEDEEQQKWWQGLDLTVCEDTEILKAAGRATQTKVKEIEENSFLKEFLKLLVRRQASAFLLEEDGEGLKEMEEELKLIQSNLYVIGRDTMDHYTENMEGLINAINTMAPRVILSRLPHPESIRLMSEYHQYLNSSVWLSLPETLANTKSPGLKDRMTDLIYKKLLHKKIHQFAQEQEEK